MPSDETSDTATREPPYPLVYVGRSSKEFAAHYGERLEQLDDEGLDVHVLAAPDGGFEEIAERGLAGQSIPVGRSWNVPGLIGAFFIIQSYFIEYRPVLVHGFDGPLAWMAALAARRTGTPTVFATVDRHRFGDEPADLGATRARLAAPRLIERLEAQLGELLGGESVRQGFTRMYRHLGGMVTRYFATDEDELRRLNEEELVPLDKLEHGVPGNGVDTDRYDPEEAPEPEEARQRFDLPDAWRRVLGYTGPLTCDRLGLELLEAIEALAGERREVGWLIGTKSDAEYSRTLEKRLRTFEERDVVRLVESPDEEAFFRALDLFVLPRGDKDVLREGMKAAAMKVGTLAGDVSGASTLVADGQTGTLVPAGNREALNEALEALVGDPRRLSNYSVRARSRATERLDRRRIDKGIIDIYDRILRNELTS